MSCTRNELPVTVHIHSSFLQQRRCSARNRRWLRPVPGSSPPYPLAPSALPAQLPPSSPARFHRFAQVFLVREEVLGEESKSASPCTRLISALSLLLGLCGENGRVEESKAVSHPALGLISDISQTFIQEGDLVRTGFSRVF